MVQAVKNTVYAFQLIQSAARGRNILCFIQHIWETFVNLVFVTLLPKYLINAYGEKAPYREVLTVLAILWLTQIGYSLYSNYYHQVFRPISDEKIYRYIQKGIFMKSLGVPYCALDHAEYYNDFTKANEEAKGRVIAVAEQVMQLMVNLGALLVLLYVIAGIHPGFVFIAALPAVLRLLWGKRMDFLIFQGDMEALKADRKISCMNRTFFLKQYSKEIKISKISRVLFQQFSNAVNDMVTIRKRHGKRIACIKALNCFFNDIVCYFASVALALYLWHHQAILLGDFVLAVTSLSVFTQRLGACADGLFTLYNARNYMENLIKFMPVHARGQSGEQDCKKEVPMAFYRLELKNVSFQYAGSTRPILKKVSLKIDAGKRIALVGCNGAGKSTLIKLLLRLYEAGDGEILLNGKPVGNYSVEAYRSLFSCVFQDYALFGCTIGENILCRHPREDDGAVIQYALEKSGLDEDMRNMNLTVDTVVTKEFDNDGVVFSGGQMQKLAIARAVANDRGIIIMDEPSSALDPLAEKKMFQRFQDISRDKTLIYISHRISSAISADIIYFMEDGQIVEAGSHEELIRLNRKYAGLYGMQSRNYKNQ